MFSLSNISWIVIKLICLVFVILSTALNIYQAFFTDKSITKVQNKNLKDIEFPIIFNIMVKPGFNESILKDYGYESTIDYFLGTTNINDNNIGWGGLNATNRTEHDDYVRGNMKQKLTINDIILRNLQESKN